MGLNRRCDRWRRPAGRIGQHGQLGRERLGRDLELPRNLARRQARFAGLDQQAEDRQPIGLGEGGETKQGN